MFKNLRFYQLDDAAAILAGGIEERLAERRFRPCGPLETASFGWVAPLGERAEALTHSGNGCLLVSARRQERLLPSAVVAEVLDERVAEIEDREARDVGRAERRRLREEILVDLLPRAFTRSRQVRVYVDGVAGLLVVDAASDKAAEELVSLLRETLGTLRARPPRPVHPPVSLMTAWVNGGELPEGLALGDECELRDARDERSVVRCRGQDLAGEEISTHLRAGKEVVKLALDWQERLSFVLQEDLSLKRLRFADALIEESEELQSEDPGARFDAELAILVLELRGLLDHLQRLFAVGGEPS